MIGYKCEHCPYGRVHDRYYDSFDARFNGRGGFLLYQNTTSGKMYSIPNATIGICDDESCKAKYYHAKEMKRWSLLVKSWESNWYYDRVLSDHTLLL